MARIYPEYAYGSGPRDNCWWDETIDAPNWPRFQGNVNTTVAIIGGGFTGMSAALHLAEAGCDVMVFEAKSPGWGASGRNGGFCCLGGAKLSPAAMHRQFGKDAARTYADSEQAAVDLCRDLLATHKISADIHSQGETQLAHSPRAMSDLRKEAQDATNLGRSAMLIEQSDLAGHGLAGPFFGALTTPVGFGVNPRKFLFGLADAAKRAGARLFRDSPIIGLRQSSGFCHLDVPGGRITARHVIIATNGYSNDTLPDWLRGRYLPSQSSIQVTRPLTDAELANQGWTSDQMAYDSRHLLHYFRLMPDRRFLFGMRGGLGSSARAEEKIRRQLHQHFIRMFPAWQNVEITHRWSGLISLGAGLVPFIGAVPDHPGFFAGLNYHGNGVAMGTYAGRLLADLVQGQTPQLPYSPIVQSAPKFPLGAARRLLLPLAYTYYGAKDFSFATSKARA